MRRKRPERGQKRIVRKFLWLPLEIDGEMRWLERATIEEQVQYFPTGWDWMPRRWIEGGTE
jgi:hypothetical protein